ncbi:LacI family DNA-binding transcriptional regulator [Lachnoclostridium sp. Marseille-P6806]|uniref:LacI family DNA-binding transcriptional regulator n=1 Tax=Lachnoclostridium sp. Marseille-P6806 TaxID=2364793 RepID=UPI0010300176|nr:LacI family DNA-binding transcriptional regulator [Lachnoclostridium sp. Marseille-P6806]
MVSLKDISAACGVSIATVSKALNNHNDISAETKAHIKEVAAELGYYPNSAAKALKTNRTYNIGMLFVDEAQNGLTHDFFAYILDSFKRKAESMGYDITFINGNKTRSNRMSYLAHARYRGFDGVCIACVNFYDPEVLELVRSDIPVVTIDHMFNNRTAILSDNVGGMRDLLSYVYGKGHRRISFIHGLDSSVTQGRVSSFFKTADELGLEIPDEYIREAPYRNTDETARQTEELLDLPQPPTCILYPDDFSAFGGINAIKERGLSIPEDISVAGYDGIRIARHIEPQLTTIRQDAERMGMEAARELILQIERPRTTLTRQIIVKGSVYEGKTVGEI